ncbi:DUF969 domain-containing protein, partial [Streptomyces sp. SID6013]|nr:DUF969 domain-containing protein [Streptomyces sp. SID6013]
RQLEREMAQAAAEHDLPLPEGADK